MPDIARATSETLVGSDSDPEEGPCVGPLCKGKAGGFNKKCFYKHCAPCCQVKGGCAFFPHHPPAQPTAYLTEPPQTVPPGGLPYLNLSSSFSRYASVAKSKSNHPVDAKRRQNGQELLRRNGLVHFWSRNGMPCEKISITYPPGPTFRLASVSEMIYPLGVSNMQDPSFLVEALLRHGLGIRHECISIPLSYEIPIPSSGKYLLRLRNVTDLPDLGDVLGRDIAQPQLHVTHLAKTLAALRLGTGGEGGGSQGPPQVYELGDVAEPGSKRPRPQEPVLKWDPAKVPFAQLTKACLLYREPPASPIVLGKKEQPKTAGDILRDCFPAYCPDDKTALDTVLQSFRGHLNKLYKHRDLWAEAAGWKEFARDVLAREKKAKLGVKVNGEMEGQPKEKMD